MSRLWRFRLLQASPLVVIALIAAAWFSLPTEVRGTGLTKMFMIGVPDEYRVSDQEIKLSVMEALVQSRMEGDGAMSEAVSVDGGPRPIEALARTASGELETIEPAVCDERGFPRTLSDDELGPLMTEIEEFEDEQDATVAVLVLPAAALVPVVHFSLADPSILTAEELAELEGEGTIDTIRRTVRRMSEGTPWPNVEVLNGPFGEEIDGRLITTGMMLLDGHLWETYTVSPPEFFEGDPVTGGIWESVDDENLAWAVETSARGVNGCVFVVGPAEAGPAIVRPAAGLEPEDIRAVWDSTATGSPDGAALWQPMALHGAALKAADGASFAEIALAGSGPAPRVAILALYDSHPRVGGTWDRIGRDPYSVYCVGVGSRLAEILGLLGVLLVASLVASPLAFRAERLHAEQVEVERERARVQNETELRVVERLNELSARMDAVIAVASDSTAAGVEGVAEDIESTIAELRAILGAVSLQEQPDE